MEVRPNYVGAYYDWDTDAVIVWERDETGRKAVAHYAPYYFYVPDAEGEYTSIFGDKLKTFKKPTVKKPAYPDKSKIGGAS